MGKYSKEDLSRFARQSAIVSVSKMKGLTSEERLQVSSRIHNMTDKEIGIFFQNMHNGSETIYYGDDYEQDNMDLDDIPNEPENLSYLKRMAKRGDAKWKW